MDIKFSSMNDMTNFAKYLSHEFEKLEYKNEAKQMIRFSYIPYTTSSEYFEEFRALLKNLLEKNIIQDEDINKEIKLAIKAINKALRPRLF